MTDMLMTRRGGGDEELVRRLDAYARLALSPSAAASARMRAAVMIAAHRSAAVAAAATPALLVAERSRRSPRSRWLPALLAATLGVLLLGGVALASGPGAPLYPVRLWAEAVTLPAGGVARVTGDLDRLQQRVDEAIEAARTGDAGAVDAALSAYDDIVADALATAGGDQVQLDRVRDALSNHLAVLNALLGRVPDAARPGIQNAIDNSDRVVEGRGTGNGGSTGNGAGDGAGNGGAGGSSGGGPDKTPPGKPSPSPNPADGNGSSPAPSDIPTPTPKVHPDPSQGPDHTPPPHPSNGPASPAPAPTGH